MEHSLRYSRAILLVASGALDVCAVSLSQYKHLQTLRTLLTLLPGK